MGVIADFFTDPPELVAEMCVKPGELLKLTIAEAEQVGPDRFVEQVETNHAHRRGMAPARKRPRRVAKKLAARGYSAHFGGPAFTAAQVRSTKHSAPALARWLGRPGLPTSALTIELAAVQFGEGRLAPVEPGCAGGPSLQVYRVQSAPDLVIGAAPMLQRNTLVAMNYGVECAIYKRQVRCLIRVFREDEDASPAEVVIKPVVERIAGRLVYAIARAAHGWTDTKVVSRQTSYRPIER